MHLKAYKLSTMKADSDKPKRAGVLLKGLAPVRIALGLRQDKFAEQAGIHQTHLSRLENLKQGSSGTTLSALAGILNCKPVDLMEEPSPARLAEIVADNDEQRAKKSRAKARKLNKQARAS